MYQQNTMGGGVGGGGGVYTIFQLGKQSKIQIKISYKYTHLDWANTYLQFNS